MLKYNQLKDIALSNFNMDLLELAKRKGLDVRNQDQCKKDWKNNKNPLFNNKAILAFKDGNYVIYYDDREQYYRYYIAHEIAHFLLKHYKDSKNEECEADILACIIIAPINKIIEKNIFSYFDLFEKFKIPLTQAEKYHSLLLHNEPMYMENIVNSLNDKEIIPDNGINLSKSKIQPIYLYIISTLLIFLSAVFIFSINNSKKSKTLDVIQNVEAQKEIPTTIENNANIVIEDSTEIKDSTISENNIDNEKIVFITSSGEKYHLSNCRYVKNKTNVSKFSLKDAIKNGYEPCSICIE